MRMVRLTIEYDMDDLDKSLEEELRNWLDGDITVMDLYTLSQDGKQVIWNDDVRVRLREIDSQGEVK